MGWQDAPVVGWKDAPIAPEDTTAPNAKPNAFYDAVMGPVLAMGGLGEAAFNMGTGMVAAPIAGLAGLAVAAGNKLGLTETSPADAVYSVQDSLTYQPQLDEGKLATDVVTYPFAKLAEGADVLGGKVAEQTNSPALGAAVNTGIQMSPALAFRNSRSRPQVSQNPELVAQAWISQNTSLNWNALSDGFRRTLTDIASSAGRLDSLDPKAVERAARFRSLDIPATRGQITRNPVQLRNENNVAATDAGAPIRAVHDAQNAAILSNLEQLRAETRGVANSSEQVGGTVQGALRNARDKQSARTNEAYEKARNSPETAELVDPTPIRELIRNTPDNVHYGWVESWLNKVVPEEGQGVSIKALEDLRQAATARSKDGGTAGFYAGELIRKIDQVTEGSGGDLYAAARAQRRNEAMLYQDQQAVAKLVSDKTRMDPVTAPEKTFNTTVISGTIDGLRQVKGRLLSRDAGPDGVQAFRDLRAQTVQHIINEATKGIAPRPDGSASVTAAGLRQGVESVGRQKLEVLFNKAFVDKLYQVLEATKDVATSPPERYAGSSTAANLLAFLERGVTQIPYLGDTVVGGARAVQKIYEMGRNSREARTALESPLEEAAANAQRSLNRYNEVNNALLATIPAAEQFSYRNRAR